MATRKGHDLKKLVVSTTGLGIMLLTLILLNLIIFHLNIRWDTTEDNVFSLSQGSKNVLANLKEPMTVKFFFSRSNPDFPRPVRLYAKRVRDFLSEYEYGSNGRVLVEEYDPRVDSDEEEWAQKYGMRAGQTQSGDRIYSGLVFVAADREERIPFLNPSREGLLEYDLTRIIYQLQSSRKKILGIITDLPVFGSGEIGLPEQPGGSKKPWQFVAELKKTYEVKNISSSAKEIDSGVDLLLIVHPKEMSQALQYGVDQYVLGGGKALVFVDPYCLTDESPAWSRQPPLSALPKLFKGWGISMDPLKVVADLGQSTMMRMRGRPVEDNPLVISARGEAFNQESVVSSQLEIMVFGFSGAISKDADSPYEFEPLVQTSANAGLIPVIQVNSGLDVIRKDFTPAGERLTLAAQVRGKFKTAFPSGPPPQPGQQAGGESGTGQEEPEKVHLSEGTATASIIVVADVDLLADQFYIRSRDGGDFTAFEMLNDNYNFVANGCEILTGGDELISLRSRGRFQRPFTTVLELQRRAQDRWLAKEQELARQAAETNLRLRQLSVQKDQTQRAILTPEQEGEIRKFQEEKQRINRELKEVRKNLRADIEALGTRLKAINIFLMPLCVAIAGLGFALYKQRRMKKP